MKPVALIKAREHLDLAKAAAERLNLENGFKAYEQAWSDFLSQASRFYSKMEQGCKGCNKSEPWFGNKKHERRTDALMSYLHHARDSDEHGLERIAEKTGERLNVHMKKGATDVHAKFEMMLDSNGKIHIRNPETSTPQSIDRFEMVNPRTELVTVRDHRFGDKFNPPEMHLDRPIVDKTPLGLAKIAIRYLESALNEASTLPKHI